jgi:HAD superfamily hydrolase (TIGR01490 family)
MSRPAVAIFDLDGTIARGDTYLGFLLHVLRRRPRRAIRLAGLPLAVARFKLGRLSNDRLKSMFLTAIVGGSTRAELARHVESYLPLCLGRMIKPAALARIEWHRARGDRLLLASASVDLYVEPLGARLRFDRTISTRTAWLDDRLTGALEGANLRGEAKLEAVREAIGAVSPRPEIYAYSDHHSDLPLLLFADRAVAVNPSRKLLASARVHGFKVEYW